MSTGFSATFSEEQRMIQETARNFAQNEIAPYAAELDEKSEFPSEIIKKLGELGFMGMFIPEEHGGAGMDIVSYVLAMIEINAACASTGVTMSVNNSLVCHPLYLFGTDEQKKTYLPDLARGKKLGCYCLSEPGTGSDAAAQSTTAQRDGDYYVLNGTKNFITNGPHADVAIVFAMSDKSKGNKGISAFIIPKETPGYSVGKIEKKLGIRASSTSQIVLEDCRVPAANLLHEEGLGFKVAMTTLDGGRIGIAAQAVGIARAAYEESVRYTDERKAFGKKIREFQGLQWIIADMATRIEAATLLTLQAAALKDAGIPHSKQASMAKLFASETAMFCAAKGLQLYGGYGYLQEYPAERHYRDAKITEIYEGTSEIQRLVISANAIKELLA